MKATRPSCLPRSLPVIATLALLAPTVGALEVPAPVKTGPDGRLTYDRDEAGGTIPDFSQAGYRGGGVALPEVAARVIVHPTDGDDGPRIQAAIDHVASLAADGHGHRGAVQLAPGRFEISGHLVIRTGGVVLRGAGDGENGTLLVATGTGRRTLITLGPEREAAPPDEGIPITDALVPVGGSRLTLAPGHGFETGDAVRITRPSPEAWIRFTGMDRSPGRHGYHWKPGTADTTWDRVVAEVDGDVVTLDAPLTLALEQRFGGASVRKVTDTGTISACGVEQLRCLSEFDEANPLDEDHAWNAVSMERVRDGWVSSITAAHFSGSAVLVGDGSSRVTVRDCVSLAPVSEHGGYRRTAFHGRGQQVLFLRCRSEDARHDFSTGYLTAGPVVFLDCESVRSTGPSGSLGSWSSGLLFDGVSIDGGSLQLDHLETANQGVGWSAANSVLWQCSASRIVCRQPPGAANHAVGVWGQLIGDGVWSETHRFVKPVSLYRAQLAERLGESALRALDQTTPVPTPDALPTPPPPAVPEEKPADPLVLENGILKIGGERLSGRNGDTAWWRGRLEPTRAADVGPAITRFAPGRNGPGLTDELAHVAASLAKSGHAIFRHHPGLWYDRRRDDHQMTRRTDGDVWPPFFEQPFARSGQGTAWDGLSRYDLTKPNPWYFGRLREFARHARSKRLVLMSGMYFQHNIIESGAHWVDSPWRPVNNINRTGFTEPPPFSGDTISMAAEFYDITHPVRRALHRATIRHHLDALGGESNVIHTLGAEFTGPLPFVEFWIDEVAAWKEETGLRPLIALSAPKDVQDAILADPMRSPTVDVIDLSYWFRTDDGLEFAPDGGRSRAPRQELRKWKGGRPSARSITAMAREYRERFPEKAVITGLPQASDVQPE